MCIRGSKARLLRPAAPGQTLTGIDVLEAQNFAPLAGKRVGLITNQTGIDRNGRSTIDLLAHAPGVKLVALFSPEHGIRGAVDERVSSTTDEATGLPIYSLYGETERPTDAMLDGVDALVFDIQDAGVRFYTYITTMGYTMEAARGASPPVLRAGSSRSARRRTHRRPDARSRAHQFCRLLSDARAHGHDAGRNGARCLTCEKKIGCDLHVIRLQNWRRQMWFDETGLPWVNPSPNLRSAGGGTALSRPRNSAGRRRFGRARNDAPFELLGAPWIRGEEFAAVPESARDSRRAIRAGEIHAGFGLV